MKPLQTATPGLSKMFSNYTITLHELELRQEVIHMPHQPSAGIQLMKRKTSYFRLSEKSRTGLTEEYGKKVRETKKIRNSRIRNTVKQPAPCEVLPGLPPVASFSSRFKISSIFQICRFNVPIRKVRSCRSAIRQFFIPDVRPAKPACSCA